MHIPFSEWLGPERNFVWFLIQYIIRNSIWNCQITCWNISIFLHSILWFERFDFSYQISLLSEQKNKHTYISKCIISYSYVCHSKTKAICPKISSKKTYYTFCFVLRRQYATYLLCTWPWFHIDILFITCLMLIYTLSCSIDTKLVVYLYIYIHI